MFGPAMLMPEGNNNRKDASFRVLTDFLPGTDNLVTRLDIKIADKHFVVGFNSSNNGDCDLAVPTKAVEAVLGIRTTKEELTKSLEELLNHLKNDTP